MFKKKLYEILFKVDKFLIKYANTIIKYFIYLFVIWCFIIILYSILPYNGTLHIYGKSLGLDGVYDYRSLFGIDLNKGQMDYEEETCHRIIEYMEYQYSGDNASKLRELIELRIQRQNKGQNGEENFKTPMRYFDGGSEINYFKKRHNKR